MLSKKLKSIYYDIEMFIIQVNAFSFIKLQVANKRNYDETNGSFLYLRWKDMHSVGLSRNPSKDKQRAPSFIEFWVSQWCHYTADIISTIWIIVGQMTQTDMFSCQMEGTFSRSRSIGKKQQKYFDLLTPSPSQMSCPHDTVLVCKANTGAWHILASYNETDDVTSCLLDALLLSFTCYLLFTF